MDRTADLDSALSFVIGRIAFTIGGPNNMAYAAGKGTLWTVDLTTGAETRVGPIGSAATLVALAVMP